MLSYRRADDDSSDPVRDSLIHQYVVTTLVLQAQRDSAHGLHSRLPMPSTPTGESANHHRLRSMSPYTVSTIQDLSRPFQRRQIDDRGLHGEIPKVKIPSGHQNS